MIDTKVKDTNFLHLIPATDAWNSVFFVELMLLIVLLLSVFSVTGEWWLVQILGGELHGDCQGPRRQWHDPHHDPPHVRLAMARQ